MSDDRYLSSKNKAICVAVDYVNSHIDTFIQTTDDIVYSCSDSDDVIDENAFEGDDEPLPIRELPRDYLNI